MKDPISVTRIAGLHPRVREDFKNFITDAENALGITIRVTQGMRTFEEQQALYDMGRTKPGKIVTQSKAGQSYHNYGLAVDLVELLNGEAEWGYDMGKLVPFADKYNIQWGGNWTGFKDRPHFEKHFGINWRELLSLYQNKKFIQGTEYVTI